MKQMIKKLSLTTAVAFSLLLMFAVPSMAQHGPGPGHHDSIPPPPPPPPFHKDSVVLKHLPNLDSLLIAHLDSLAKAHHDSFPPPPPPPPFHKDTSAVNHPPKFDSLLIAHFDSLRARHDSFPPPPPFHLKDSLKVCKRAPLDSTLIAKWDSLGQNHGPWFDSFPPPPHDSTGRGHRIEATNNDGSGVNSSAAASIVVYPNPVIESAVIHIENTVTGNVTFSLYDGTGRLVVQKDNLGNGNYQLSKDNLATGLYIYSVYDGSAKVSTGKIVIQ